MEALAESARTANPGDDEGRAALGALCEACLRDVTRIFVHLGAGPNDLDDLIQNAMLQICRGVASFERRATFRIWLYGLCARVYLHHRRGHGRLRRMLERVRVALEPRPAIPTPLEQAAEREALARIEQAVGHLRPKQRAVFVLREVEGLTCEEIAVAIGVPIGTVWTRLHHARRELVERLGPVEPGPAKESR